MESSPVSSKQSLKECTPSPKSGSFVSAVIGAIRNAATHPFATRNIDKKSNLDSSKQIYKGNNGIHHRGDCNLVATTNGLHADVFKHTFCFEFCIELSMESSSDLLDFETEPCLMMESVLEDVPLLDTYSHNMVSSSDSLRRALSFPETVDEHNMRKSKISDECTSLTNLTQAILHRRKASILRVESNLRY